MIPDCTTTNTYLVTCTKHITMPDHPSYTRAASGHMHKQPSHDHPRQIPSFTGLCALILCPITSHLTQPDTASSCPPFIQLPTTAPCYLARDQLLPHSISRVC
jgi:hypothetical protein